MRALATALALMLLGASAAGAQSRCGPRQAILDIAFDQYDERPVAMALASGGALLEVLAAPDGRTFTMLHTDPEGISCILSAGGSWQVKPWQPPARKGTGS